MLKSQEQINALVQYFAAGCKPQGKLTLGLEVEHFITHLDGSPVTFPQVQDVMRAMQQPSDRAILIDGLYMGFNNERYGISLEPACQLEISVAPCAEVLSIMQIYQDFFSLLGSVLATRGMRAYAIGFHPFTRAEDLALIPKKRYQVMNDYFKTSGQHGIHMMRATASTQLSIDYYSEQDFINKYRAACLITPLLALLTDNAPVYQGAPNYAYSVRTHIWQDVDPDRCGIPPFLMEEDFGFAAYAAYLLQKPLIVVKRGERSLSAGRSKTGDAYGRRLRKGEIEHILSMFFFDVRLKNYIEIRGADSMPPRYIAAYAQLIRTIFSSPAALEGILRHYAGRTVREIEDAKQAVCRSGYHARIYGSPAVDEVAWLLAQAKSRILLPEERHLLDPFICLAAQQKTIREVEHYV